MSGGTDHILSCIVCDVRHNHIVTSRLVVHSLSRRVSLKRLRVPMARRPPPRAPGLFLFSPPVYRQCCGTCL